MVAAFAGADQSGRYGRIRAQPKLRSICDMPRRGCSRAEAEQACVSGGHRRYQLGPGAGGPHQAAWLVLQRLCSTRGRADSPDGGTRDRHRLDSRAHAARGARAALGSSEATSRNSAAGRGAGGCGTVADRAAEDGSRCDQLEQEYIRASRRAARQRLRVLVAISVGTAISTTMLGAGAYVQMLKAQEN